MIVVQRDGDKPLTLLTNDLASPARQIADLYRRRWDIELFFRWIKQHLKIKRFHGRSANAVRLQIAAAIILYIVMKIIHQTARTTRSMHIALSVIKETLFHRLDVLDLLQAVERPPRKYRVQTSPQLRLAI